MKEIGKVKKMRHVNADKTQAKKIIALSFVTALVTTILLVLRP